MPEVLRRTIVVTDPVGVHVRTAADIAKTVRQGRSQVTLIHKDRRLTETTEALQIMTLAAAPGDRVEIEAVGPDAAAVLDALEPLFRGRIDDESQPSNNRS
jgi:phosphocarrier protein HPr